MRTYIYVGMLRKRKGVTVAQRNQVSIFETDKHRFNVGYYMLLSCPKKADPDEELFYSWKLLEEF